MANEGKGILHCSARTAAALRDLGWTPADPQCTDMTAFCHDHNAFVEFWADGRVLIGEFAGQDHWQPIDISGGAWKDAWRHIIAEMHG